MAGPDNSCELVRGSGNVFADFGAPDAGENGGAKLDHGSGGEVLLRAA